MRDTEQRKYLHRELWQWLADNPTKEKYDWPGWVHRGGHYDEAPEECFACEEARARRDRVIEGSRVVAACEFCPIDWGWRNCEMGDSPFACWSYAQDTKERRKYAERVRDAWK